MMSLEKLNFDELVKKVNNIQTTDTSNLVKKTYYNTKINEIEKIITDHDHSNKYITTKEFDKLNAESFAAKLAKENLATKSDITAFVRKTDFGDKVKILNKKVNSSKTKHVEDEKKISDLTNKGAQISGKRTFC